MPRPHIPLPRTGDRRTQATSDAINKTARQQGAGAVPLFGGDGKEFDVTFDVGGVQHVQHGLKRQPRGWLFYNVQCDTGATLLQPYVVKGSATPDGLDVELGTTAPTTLKIYIF